MRFSSDRFCPHGEDKTEQAGFDCQECQAVSKREWSDEEREAIEREFMPGHVCGRPWAAATLAANLTVALLDARAEIAALKQVRSIADAMLYETAKEALAAARIEAQIEEAEWMLANVCNPEHWTEAVVSERLAELRAEKEKLG